MPFSDATGPKVYYQVSGEGPAFVFIHANPFDHRLWLYQVAQFSSFFRCISVDIRGYGRTDKVETPYTLADMKDDVLGVLRQEGVTSAIFCGCSVGSGIALLTGLDHPDVAKAVILVGGSSKGSAGVRKRFDDFNTTKDVKAVIEDFLREVVAPGFPDTLHARCILQHFDQLYHYLSPYATAQQLLECLNCDITGQLKDLQVPPLVINGAYDNSLPGRTATAAGVKGARHVVLPGTGHACNIEEPEAFNNAASEFLKANGLWAGTSIPMP